MQDGFGDSRIKKVFQLIKEILHCWFKHNIEEENQAQIEGMLAQIQNTKSDIIININGEIYLVVVTLHNEAIKLTIVSRKGEREISDQKLKLFKVAVERAKKRPENEYLSPITVKLQNNRLIFAISCQVKTSAEK